MTIKSEYVRQVLLDRIEVIKSDIEGEERTIASLKKGLAAASVRMELFVNQLGACRDEAEV